MAHLRLSAPARRRGTGMVVGAMTARMAFAAMAAANPAALRRTNFRGVEVTLAAGPALIAGTAAGGACARVPGQRGLGALLWAVGAAAVAGAYDDVYGSTSARGLAGHLRSLRAGTVTTGIAKVAVIGAGAALAAHRLGGPPGDRAARAALIAGSANLINLLDLRPGRAAKAALVLGGPLLARSAGWPTAGAVGAAAGLLGVDLGERAMLGDAGANALGAALGVALAGQPSRRGRASSLVAVAALNLASERISFTAVIDSVPPLRWLDQLGRTP